MRTGWFRRPGEAERETRVGPIGLRGLDQPLGPGGRVRRQGNELVGRLQQIEPPAHGRLRKLDLAPQLRLVHELPQPVAGCTHEPTEVDEVVGRGCRWRRGPGGRAPGRCGCSRRTRWHGPWGRSIRRREPGIPPRGRFGASLPVPDPWRSGSQANAHTNGRAAPTKDRHAPAPTAPRGSWARGIDTRHDPPGTRTRTS